MSSVVLFVYWLLLALFALAAVGMTTALTAGEVKPGPMPIWSVAVLTYGVPVLIGWRIWVIRRARRIATLVETFDTEKNDV